MGTPPSVMLTGLPKVIRWFRLAPPGSRASAEEMSTSAVMEALRGGSVDVGFLRCPETPAGLRELFRFAEDVAAILPQNHRLASVKKLKLEQLAREPFGSLLAVGRGLSR